MYVPDTNEGLIKVNFTNDLAIADHINENSGNPGSPLVSTPYSLGGYTIPILNDIAGGRTYTILKAKIPNKANEDLRQIARVINDSSTAYPYVDTTTITIVQIDGWGSDETLRDHGWTILSDPKTPKRLKTLNRPFRLWSTPDRPIRVALIDDADYVDPDVCGVYDEDDIEKILDGGFSISRDFYLQTLGNIDFPLRPWEDQQLSDLMRARIFSSRAEHFKAFNARIFGDFEYVGCDNPPERKGHLKGQAFVNVSDVCERMGVDIIAPRSALKYQTSCTKNFVLLEPQSCKFQATGDAQSISNNPALFMPDSVKNYTENFMASKFKDLTNDKIMESWFKMDAPEYSVNGERKYTKADLINLTKWNARFWIMSGMSLKQSPFLFEQMANNLISMLDRKDDRKMPIPIPCAVRAQVVSQSFASLCGEDFEEDSVIERGVARWSEALEVLVVHDEDWIEMYPSHGGCDLDDFFVVMWRTFKNQRKIVIFRSPNDFGEYSMFDYHHGDWYPQEHLSANNSYVLFPEIPDDESLWPKRLSEAVRDGEVIYDGLPSEVAGTPESTREFYSLADVAEAISNNQGTDAAVGANVNARALYSTSVRAHRPRQLTTMESCIDSAVQGGSRIDIDAVMGESLSIIDEIITGNYSVDKYLWFTRFATIHGKKLDPSRLTSTHMTKIHDFRKKYVHDFMVYAKKYARGYCAVNLDPRIHSLGRRRLLEGYDHVKQARFSTYEIQKALREEGLPTERVWDTVHAHLRAKILDQPTEAERHDFVMGLYSSTLKALTSTTGRVTDQLMMNPDLFDLLMEALRYYGIAAHLYVDDSGSICRYYTNEWDLTCSQTGRHIHTNNPLYLQYWHANDHKLPKKLD